MNKQKEKRRQWLIPLVFSIILLAAVGVTLEVLAAITRYLPLRLCGIFCEFAALLNTVLALGRARVSEKNIIEKPLPDNLGKVRRFFIRIWRAVLRGVSGFAKIISRRRVGLTFFAVLLIVAGYQFYFFFVSRRITSIYTLWYYVPVVLLAFFIVFIVAEKWCKHASQEGREAALLRNLRVSLVIARLFVMLAMISTALKLLNLFDAQRYLAIALSVLWYYSSVFIAVSLTVRLIRRELVTNPRLNIPIPFAGGADSDLGVLSYLEENTGITMRSLWSLKFIRALLPYTIMIAALLLWVSTGLVQVESYQQGAVYRFGRMLDKPLDPGLHLTLPWPFDKVVLYDTESVKRMTIGYRSETDSDNTWTGNHGMNEYKLLLGGGKELISINLRIEYKIKDLKNYLMTSSSPEKLLEAAAYELVTGRTINSNLETLLSINRSDFANSFKSDLTSRIDAQKTGLEVTSVVLESIHPPVEIADIYQRVISAGIEREKYILDAEAQANVRVSSAKREADTAISTANANYYNKTAEARAEVSTFMASVSADNAASDAYRYYKYLSAITKAYGSARLVIVGEGIDSSNIYFGGVMLTQ